MYTPPLVRGNARTRTNRGIATAALTLATACISAHGQISFTETIDFSNYQHGSIVDPGAYAGFQYISPQIGVTPPSGGFNRAVIFATEDPNVPAPSPVEDQDLIPNGTGNQGFASLGNVAIIQENTNFTTTNNRIDNPYVKVDDHANGGKFTFELNPDNGAKVDSFRITFIDIEKAGDFSIKAYDSNSSFTWSGAALKALDNSIVFGNASANRTSLLSGGLSGITKVEFISKTSFAIDNFEINGTAVPEPTSGLLAILSASFLCFRRQRKA